MEPVRILGAYQTMVLKDLRLWKNVIQLALLQAQQRLQKPLAASVHGSAVVQSVTKMGFDF